MIETGQVIGNYQIESSIGKGGMGHVYLAYDLRLERQVAIKTINMGKYEEHELDTVRARFAVEAKALAKLNDPHIVQIFDFDPEHNPPYLVMEYVTGRNLSQLIHTDQQIPMAKVLDTAAQVLSGLHVAHRSNIIHRDIKPSNILLTSTGTYKLLDFGLARATESKPTDPQLTADNAVIGTLQYLAPEVARGQNANEQSDIYSLGLTLYHLATGILPHDGVNRLELLNSISTKPLPPINVSIPDIPATLAQWFDRMLAFEATNRFTHAHQALESLQELSDSLDLSGIKRAVFIDQNVSHNDTGSQDTVLLKTKIDNPSSLNISSHRPIQQEEKSKAKTSRRKFSLGFYLKLLTAIWLISSIGVYFAINYIANETLAEQIQQLKKHLRASAAAAAMLIDGDAHTEIHQASNPNDPRYQKMFADLTKFRDTNIDILNIYTMAKGTKTEEYGIVEFVIDASEEIDENSNNMIDEDEAVADIGEEYHAQNNAPMILEGFQGPCTDKQITTDKWGSFLSGYAPILNANGESVAIVGIDISSDMVTSIRQRSHQRAILIECIAFVAFLAAAFIVANRLNRPISLFKQSLSAAADGDYSKAIQLKGFSEFSDLAQSINRLLEELSEKETVRRAYELFVAREMNGQLTGRTSSSNLVPDTSKQTFIYCTFDQDMSNQDINIFEKILAKTIRCFFDQGGIVEQMVGSGILVTMFDVEGEQIIEENAIRAALSAQQTFRESGGRVRFTISIHTGETDGKHRHLIGINDLAQQTNSDILISESIFDPVKMMFYADIIQNVSIGNLDDVNLYAIKGAVSA